MKKKGLGGLAIAAIGIGVFILLLVLWFVAAYNSLVGLEEGVDAAWAQVENQYQRRIDLIPNLVATVQGAADFESDTQTQIAELRTGANAAKAKWDGAQTQDEKIAAANEMETVAQSFRSLNINVENYPQLRATENFLALQTQLEGTENRVSVERRRYNEAVRDYNIKIRRIPTNIVAGMYGFEKKELFEAVEGSEVAPTVEFN